MANNCVFAQEVAKCIEHGGAYTGSPTCGNKSKGDRLDAKIAKLQEKRDRMRLVYVTR